MKSELRVIRERLDLSQPAMAVTINKWWRGKSGTPATYDGPRIGHFERGALPIPPRIMWFMEEHRDLKVVRHFTADEMDHERVEING